jgi:Peptidase family M48
VTERPNTLLAAVLAAAALIVAAVSAALVVTGQCRVTGVGSGLLSVVTGCYFFTDHNHRVGLLWLVLFIVSGLSVGAFVSSLALWVRSPRLLLRLPVEPIGTGPLAQITTAMGTRLYVAPSRRPAAFCDGLVRPRVVITAGLLAELSPAEQAAAVWHEAHHARRREPLACLTVHLVARAFFWIPALRDVIDRYLLAKELIADRLAASKTDVHALAGALWAAAPAPTPAIGLAELASARIGRLLDPDTKLPPLFGRRRLIATGLTVLLLIVLAAFPTTVDLDPRHLVSFL